MAHNICRYAQCSGPFLHAMETNLIRVLFHSQKCFIYSGNVQRCQMRIFSIHKIPSDSEPVLHQGQGLALALSASFAPEMCNLGSNVPCNCSFTDMPYLRCNCATSKVVYLLCLAMCLRIQAASSSLEVNSKASETVLHFHQT